MPHHAILALIALLFLLFGAFSKRFEDGVFTAPMLCVLVGLTAGPLGLGLIELQLDNEVLTIIGEVALAVILFTDASGIVLSRLRQVWSPLHCHSSGEQSPGYAVSPRPSFFQTLIPPNKTR